MSDSVVQHSRGKEVGAHRKCCLQDRVSIGDNPWCWPHTSLLTIVAVLQRGCEPQPADMNKNIANLAYRV
jgi:hypothetical protein